MELEQRLVFDAAAVATLDPQRERAAADPASADPASHEAAATDSATALAHALGGNAAPSPSGSDSSVARQLVVLDPSLADYEQLLRAIPADARVLLLDPARDGVAQLVQALRGEQGLDAIHILSHGASGELVLGASRLNAASMASEHADALRSLRGALSDGADILIYGCDFGAGAAGAHAVDLLAELTGADVAASTDPTGAEALGGDWELELRDGPIEAIALAVPGWDHLLAAPTLADTTLTLTVQEDAGDPSGAVGSLISAFTGGISDPDAGAVKGIAVTATVVTNGNWFFSIDNGGNWTNMGTPSPTTSLLLADDGQTRIYFQPKADFNGNAGTTALSLRAWDRTSGSNGGTASTSANGGNTAFSSATDTIAVTVAPVNDAPTLLNVARTLTAIAEDAAAPSRRGVGTAVDAASFNINDANVSDVDTSPLKGIAITGADTANGTWWYSTNGGTNWLALGAVANNNALLLIHSANSKVYFQPNADYNGSANLTIRAWDQTGATAGGNGTKVDTSVNGGTTPFSSDARPVSISVNAVDDTVADVVSTAEDTAKTFNPITGVGESSGADNFENSNRVITKVDGQSIAQGGTITLSGGRGTITLASNGSNDLLYTPTPNFNAPSGFTIAYEVTTGGTTESENITITVTAVADALHIDLDTATIGTGYTTSYDHSSVPIGNLISVSNPDGNIEWMKVVLAGGAQTGDTLLVSGSSANNGMVNGIAWTRNGSEINFSTRASPTSYQAALGLVKFSTTSVVAGSRTVTVEVASSVGGTSQAVATITPVTPIDTDGDGTLNNADIDDDNDGILDTIEGSSMSLNAIVNGDFTAGDFGFTSELEDPMPGSYPTYNGVVASGSTGGNYTATWDFFGGAGGTRPAGSGAYLITNDIAEQQGQSYAVVWNQTANTPANVNLEFFLQLTSTGTYLDFLVDGVSLTNGPQFYDHNQDWRDYVFGFNTGARTSVTIEIRQHTSGGALGDAGFDNFDLRRNFAEADIDNDGIVGRLDIDSDNDGITDNVEAQATQRYIAPSGIGAAMVDIDNDGLDDVYDANTTSAGSLGLTPVDTDGDAAQDYLDADSDGDGALDIAERGDGQPTSLTSSTDTDHDGLLDIFEAGTLSDGFDVNDNNLIGTTFNLADGDGDTAANGADAAPRAKDLDYRDNFLSQAPPSAADDNLSTAEDTTLSANAAGGLMANDNPGGASSVSAASIDTNDDGTPDTAITLGVATTVTDSGGRMAGSLTINADGSYSFVPTADYNGSLPVIRYTISNSSGSSSARLNITVAAVADIVADTNNTITTAEDTAVNFNPVTGSNGAQADNFENPGRTITAIGGTAITPGGASMAVTNGTVSLAADGSTLTFTPTVNFNGTVTFSYTVTSAGVSETANINVVVTAVNDAPVNTLPTSFSTSEDTDLQLTGIALADVDTSSLSVTLSVGSGTLTATAGGGVTVAGTGTGSLTLTGTPAALNAYLAGASAPVYTPVADFYGNVTLTMLTNDGTATDSDTSTISVAGVADITTDSVTTNEDTAVSFNVLTGTNGATADSFENGGQVVSAVTQPPGGQGAVSFAANGVLTYTPPSNFSGSTSFTYTVTSGGVSETAAVNVTVNAVNDAPVNTLPASFSTSEDTSVQLTGLSVADVDAGTGTTTVTLSVNTGTLTASNGGGVTVVGSGTATLSLSGTLADINAYLAAASAPLYVPRADHHGSVTLTMLTNDGTATDSDTATITISAVTDIAGDSVTTNEDTPITFNAITAVGGGTADSFENPARAVTAVTQPPSGEGSVAFSANGDITYTPAANFHGSTSFSYTVTSGGVSETATVNVTVVSKPDDVKVEHLGDEVAGGLDGRVFESALPAGTQPGNLLTAGSFTLGPAANIARVSIGGSGALSVAQLRAASASSPIVIMGAHGTLRITGYDSSSGKVAYNYTLTSKADHSAGAVNEAFTIATTDNDGDITANAGTLAFAIEDDAPLAHSEFDDAINISGQPSSTASGNVITGTGGTDPNNADGTPDEAGADGLVTPELTGVVAGTGAPVGGNVGVAITGAHGTLTMNADGSYRYVPNYADPAVAALSYSASLNDVFTYQIRDTDGSTGTATLTVRIIGTPAAVGLSGAIVQESDLASGSTPGGARAIYDGGFVLAMPEPSFGLETVTVGSVTFTKTDLAGFSSGSPSVAIVMGHGELRITGYVPSSDPNDKGGTVSYRYMLTSRADHGGGTSVFDSVNVSIKDGAQNHTPPKPLAVEIIDDAPKAQDDAGDITEGVASTSGNVSTNDAPGADGGKVTGVTAGGTTVAAGLTLTGSYGQIQIDANGSYSYTLDNANASVRALGAGQSLQDIFSYQVTDADGNARTATLSIEVQGTNGAPTNTLPASYTTNEDVPLSLAGLAVNDADAGTSTMSIELSVGTGSLSAVAGAGVAVSGAGTGTLTLSGTLADLNAYLAGAGAPIYTPVADFHGTATLTLKSSDGTLTDTDTRTITINAVADAHDDTIVTNEDAPISFNVLTGSNGATADDFSDPARTVISVTQPAPGQGTVSFTADGSMIYTPPANFNGSTSFTYTVSSAGLSETATVNITVNAVNDTPLNTVPASFTSAEDTPLQLAGLSVTDVDIGGGTLTVQLSVPSGTLAATSGGGVTVGGSGSGSLSLTGTLAAINSYLATGATAPVYTPVADFHGDVMLTMVSSDGVISDTDTSTITITPVTDITADTVATNEDTPATFNVLAGGNGATADSFENVGAQVSSVTQPPPGQGTVSFLPDGTITYTPPANFNGPTSFSYTVSSGGVTETTTVNLSVNAVNDVPVNTLPATFSTAEDTSVALTGLSLADADAGASAITVDLSVSSGTLAATTGGGVTVTASGSGSIRLSGTLAALNTYLAGASAPLYSPLTDFNGSVTLSMLSFDGTASDRDSSTITVTPVADIAADSLTTPEDTPISFNVLTGSNGASADSFEDSGRIVSAITQPSAGSVSFSANGSMTYTPPDDFSGTTSFTYTVTSGGVSETATVNITVTAVNDAPVNTLPASFSTNEDTALPLTGLSIVDVDAATSSLSIRLTVTAGSLNANSTGTVAVLGAGTGTITLTGTAAELNTYLAGASAPSYMPDADFNGPVALTMLTDDGTATASDTATITVNAVDDATDDTIVTNEDTPISFNVLTGSNGATADTFEDSTRTLTSVTQPASGQGTVSTTANGGITYTPSANFNGSTSFTYTVTSGGVTETATVNVTVTAVNDTPVPSNPSVPGQTFDPSTGDSSHVTLEDTPVSGRVTATDADGDPLAFTVQNPPANGTLLLNPNGTYTYTPNGSFNGSDSFDILIDDGHGGTVISTITVTVTPVNDTPVNTLPSGGFATGEDTPLQLTGLAVADADGASAPMTITLTVSSGSLSAASGPGVTIGGTGTGALTLTGTVAAINSYLASVAAPVFTPVADFAGIPVDLAMTASDGTLSDTDNTTITIRPVADITDDSITTPEDTPISFNVLTGTNGATADNFENGARFVSSVTQPPAGRGTVSIAPDGTLTYRPSANFNGSTSFSYTVSSGGVTETATVSITVTPVSDEVTITGLGDGPEAGTDATVRESALPIGSDPGNDTTAAGSFTLGPPENMAELRIGGSPTLTPADLAGASPSTPITITGSFGSLSITGYDPVSGVVTYVYTLNARADHSSGPVNDAFTIVTTDIDGVVTPNAGTLAFNLADDAPIARAETDDVINIPDQPSSVASGNVLTGTGGTDTNTSDGVADEPGADGLAAPAVTGVVAGSGAPAGANLGMPIAGDFGTLRLNADGSYSYTPDYADPAVALLDPGETLADVFTYQISDSDGSTRSATLTLHVIGTPAIVGTHGGAVREAGLSGGTQPAAGGEHFDGDFLVVTPQFSLASVTVGGQRFELAALQSFSAANPSAAIAMDHGDLRITGYDSSSGRVNYRYTLTRTADHSSGEVLDTTTISLTDSAGNDTSAFPKTLDIRIVDDAPAAVPDNTSIEVDAASPTVTGNVLANDATGADGADAASQLQQPLTAGDPTIVTGVAAGGTAAPGNVDTNVMGLYGELRMQANGNYAYTLNATLPSVQALRAGESVVDVFSYQITDADRDIASTTLSVTIMGHNDAPVQTLPAIYTVAEDTPLALTGLSVSDADAGTDTMTITLTVSVGSLSGATVSGVTATGSGTKTLQLTGTLANLNAYLASAAAPVYTPLADFAGTVALSMRSSDGSLADDDASTITVTPIADITNDTIATNEDTPATFNVLAGTQGATADSFESGARAVTSVTQPPAGQGTVSFAADGSIRFVPARNFNGSTTFTYTVTSGGVSETATVTLNVAAMPDDVVVGGLGDGPISGTDSQVRESGLPAGTDPGTGTRVTGSFTIGPADNLVDVRIGGSGPLTPAQLAAASPASPITIAGTAGTLTLTGYDPVTGMLSYVYTLTAPLNHGGAPVNEAFTVATTDLDGDFSPAAGSLAFSLADDAPIARADTDDVINIAGQPSSVASGNVLTGTGGADPNGSDGVADVAGADGFAAPAVTGVVAGAGAPLAGNVGATLTGSFGTLRLNADGSYTYTPDYANASVRTLAPGQTLSDVFSYQITDGDGSTSTSTLTVRVAGTPAVVGTMAGSVREADLASGSTPAGSGEVYEGSFLALTPGSPLAVLRVGASTFSAAQLSAFSAGNPSAPIALAHGQLMITGYDAASGALSYRYTLTQRADHSGGAVFDGIDVSLRDGVGNDTAAFPATLRIEIVDDAPVVQADGATINEAASGSSGNVLANDRVGADASAGGAVTGVAAGGAPGAGNVGSLVTGSYGQLRLNTDGSYAYVLDHGNASVAALADGSNLNDVFSYQVTDADGDTHASTLTITIRGANAAPVNTLPASFGANEDNSVPLTGISVADSDAGDSILRIELSVPGGSLSASSGAGVTASGSGTGTLVLTGTLADLNAYLASASAPLFTPVADFGGTVVLSMSSSDGSATSTSTATITIDPVADITPETISTPSGTPARFNVLTGTGGATADTFENSARALVAVSAPPAGSGTLSFDADGTITFTPAAGFSGTFSFTYTVLSGGVAETATVTLTVQARVNGAPAAAAAAPQFAELPLQRPDGRMDRVTNHGMVLESIGDERGIWNSGITAAGIVSDAVHQSDRLNSTSGLAAQGMIAQVVREMGRWTSYTRHSESLHALAEMRHGDSTGRLGSSSDAQRSPLVVETLVGNAQVQILVQPANANVRLEAGSGFRVTLADGRAIPDWIIVRPDGVVIVRPPVGVEVLELRIQATTTTGVVEEIIRVDLSNGMLLSALEATAPVLADMFSEQLDAELNAGWDNTSALAAALGSAGGIPAEASRA